MELEQVLFAASPLTEHISCLGFTQQTGGCLGHHLAVCCPLFTPSVSFAPADRRTDRPMVISIIDRTTSGRDRCVLGKRAVETSVGGRGHLVG